MLACFATHALSLLSRGYTCPLQPLYGCRCAPYFSGGSRHLCFWLACGRCGLIGLSKFLWALTCGFCPVHFNHNATPPSQALSLIRSFRSFPLISRLVALVLMLGLFGCSSVSLRSAKLYRLAQKPPTVHSLQYTLHTHSLKPLSSTFRSRPK